MELILLSCWIEICLSLLFFHIRKSTDKLHDVPLFLVSESMPLLSKFLVIQEYVIWYAASSLMVGLLAPTPGDWTFADSVRACSIYGCQQAPVRVCHAQGAVRWDSCILAGHLQSPAGFLVETRSFQIQSVSDSHSPGLTTQWLRILDLVAPH